MSVQELSSLYSTRPDLYDLMHEDYRDDSAYLHDVVRSYGAGSHAVEFGCGTGRLLTALVDREPAMLRVAAERLSRYGGRVQLVHADMREVRLAEPADLVIVGLNTFMHLLTTRDQLTTLSRAHALLRPGGTVLLDLANPLMIARDVPLGVQQHRFSKLNARKWYCV
jgi:SAM-dependent methyltransferase